MEQVINNNPDAIKKVFEATEEAAKLQETTTTENTQVNNHSSNLLYE